MKKIIIAAALAIAAVGTTVSCSSDADVASANLSKAAENFEIARRITVYNAISNTFPLVVEGRCSAEFPTNTRVEVTCKLENGSYIKDFVDKGDNGMVLVEQTTGTAVDTDHYRVFINPAQIIPNADVTTG